VSNRSYAPNPPWVDRILNKRWDAILAVAPERGGVPVMPEFSSQTRTGKMQFEELGCGHYGCVIASTEPGIVFKVTSDASEAAFVAVASQMDDWPVGMVAYYGLYELPDKYRKRRTFVLWRQEAENIGELMFESGEVAERYKKKYHWTSIKEFKKNLSHFLFASKKMHEQLKRSKNPAKFLEDVREQQDIAWRLHINDQAYRDTKPLYYGAPSFEEVRSYHKGALAFALRQILVKQLATVMGSTHAGSLVGEALDHYINEGILLADVHFNNIGEVQPENYTSLELVITDPGHMVPLDPKWLQVQVPQLP